MTSTYVGLAQTTLSSATSTVTFSSIPATYRDLIIVADAIGSTTATGGYTGIRFNSDSGNNYSRVYMVGNGSSAVSASESSVNYLNAFTFPASNSNARASLVFQIMDYAQTNKHKTCLLRETDPIQFTVATAGRWASTSAVTTILLQAISNNFGAGSTFSLYGVN